ncbi:hypothetical protein [Chengkuizengella marina]|uniref:Uncharacterized protein n=1 Tax=Chengkuizengella marina TaxID=2507566 RepID=A0A6N9Q534_9BACL|nr:hypothetical protein [Chengkuizengella marina]NBI29734.1 hypothetical protein [Chengkuizengella marina]
MIVKQNKRTTFGIKAKFLSLINKKGGHFIMHQSKKEKYMLDIANRLLQHTIHETKINHQNDINLKKRASEYGDINLKNTFR